MPSDLCFKVHSVLLNVKTFLQWKRKGKIEYLYKKINIGRIFAINWSISSGVTINISRIFAINWSIPSGVTINIGRIFAINWSIPSGVTINIGRIFARNWSISSGVTIYFAVVAYCSYEADGLGWNPFPSPNVQRTTRDGSAHCILC